MLVLSTHKPKCINETDAAVHAASLPSRSVRSISLTLPRWQRKDAKRCPYTTGREYAFLQQTLNRQCTSQRCVTASSDKHVGYSFTKMPKAKQIRSAGLLWLHTRYTSPRESPVPKQRLRATNAGGACYVDQADNAKSMCKRSPSTHRRLRLALPESCTHVVNVAI